MNTLAVTPGELRRGDRVRVRSAREILATLDDTGAFEGVPFMPEMAEEVGKTFSVYKRLEKICDYLSEDSRSRRMLGAVLLEDNRCNGSGHNGCQAECRIFWKEVWLERAEPNAAGGDPRDGLEELMALVLANSIHTDASTGEELYRCQATEASRSTTPMPEKGAEQYVREIKVGNISVWEFVRVASSAITRKLLRKLRLRGEFPMQLAGENRVDGEKLGLRPGEWVRVRTPEEIGKTLDGGAGHRGLAFTLEMVPSCGNTYRVRRRVERLVNERTGQFIELKNDCIALEGVVCRGHYTSGAWFCPREHFPLWREDWLERADPADEQD